MFVLALRLLAVYFLSAAALLWMAHRSVLPLKLPVACVLALGPFLLTGAAMFTGNVYAPLDIEFGTEPLVSYQRDVGISGTRTPLLADVVSSQIPARKAVREAIRHGRFPLWNRFNMAGEPLLAFQQPAALHPATWLGLALPLAQAWTFEMSVRLLLAMLSAYLFFRELECGEMAALFGAVAWALSDHLVFWLGYPVTASVAAFPLLLLGLRRLAHGGGRGAVVIAVVSLVLIILGGHPETLLHAVAGGGVLFLFELVWATREHRGPALLRALLAGTLALGLTAVALLPLAEILPHTATHQGRATWYASSKRSVSLDESLRRSTRDLLPYAFGLSGHSRLAEGFGVPAAYAGALVLPLAVIGLGSRRREKWTLATLAILGLAFWARLAGVTDVVSKLPFFNIAVNDYLVWLGSFGLVALAVLGLDRLGRGEAVLSFAAASLLTAAILALVFALAHNELLALDMNGAYLTRRILMQCVPLAAAAVMVMVLRRSASAIALSVFVLFVASRTLEARDVYPTCSTRAFYPVPDILEKLPRPVPERVAALGYLWIPNMSALYELQDVRGYEALTLDTLVETYPLWCVPQPIWYNRIDDASKPFLSFLNVRYLFAAPGQRGPAGWTLLAEARGGRIFENPRVLPRAFMPGHVGYVRDPARQLDVLARVTDFGGFGVVKRDAGRPADSSDWEPSGTGTVRIVSDSGQRLILDVEASGPGVVATSIPRWPGWKGTVDSFPIPLLSYNRAFVGLEVPAGRHTVDLRYLPDSFVWGAWISAAALVLSLVLLRFPRARLPRGPGMPQSV